MPLILILVLVTALCQQAVAATQLIAKGSGAVPGALVCPDFNAIQTAFQSYAAGPVPRSNVEHYGCSLVAPGTVMTLEGEDPGGAPMVTATLPGGRIVRGVTLRDMVEQFERNPSLVNRPASLVSIPLPPIHNSTDTVCGQYKRSCSDQEFVQLLLGLQKVWALMPDWLRAKCVANSTFPAIYGCILKETAIFYTSNPSASAPWASPNHFPETKKSEEEAKKDAASEAQKELEYCVVPEAQYGKYSSFDGGKSAVAILGGKCSREFRTYTRACQHSGDPEVGCTQRAFMLAQMAIEKFGK